MAGSQTQLDIIIKAQDAASSELKKVAGELQKLNSTAASSKDAQSGISGLGISLGGLAGVIGGLTAGVSVFGFLKGSLDAFAESQDTVAQLNAVLTSTGGIAGQTTESAIALAKSLQQTTTYSDEQVLSAENMLLTFRNVRGQAFAPATKAVLDMATAMHTDATQAALQLGKALNDPVTGMNMLHRVGVTFNDTQKEQVANFVKTGQAAKAQAVILDELNAEFGGSAAAQAATYGGRMKQLANNFNELQETIGGMLAPVIGFIAQGMSKLVTLIQDGLTWISGLWSSNAGDIQGTVTRVFNFFAENIAPLWDAFVGALGKGWKMIKAFWDTFGGAILQNTKDVFIYITSFIGDAFKVIGDVFQIFADIFSGNWGALWNDVKKLFADIWNGIVDIGSKGMKLVIDGVNEVIIGLNKIAHTHIDPIKFDTSSLDNFKIKTDEVATNTKDKLKSVGAALGSAISDGIKQSAANVQNVGTGVATPFKKGDFDTGDKNDANKLKEKLKDFVKQYEDMAKNVARTLLEMKVAHDDSVDKSTQKLQELSDEYTKTSIEGQKAIDELAQQNKEALASIDNSISETQQKMADLNKEFAKQKQSDVQNLAEAFVAAQASIEDIKAQIRASTDPAEIQKLKEEQRVQENALQQSADVAKQFSAEIAEAKRRASLSDLQRAIEDFNAKRVLAQQEYEDKAAQIAKEMADLQTKRNLEVQQQAAKMADLKAELQAKLDKITKEQFATGLAQAEEQKIYDESTKFINDVLITANEIRRQITIQTKNVTVEAVQAEIDKYHELASAIQQAQSAKSLSLIPTFSVLGSRASGGDIPQTGPYLMHEGEYVVPKDGALVGGGGGGNVTVNINGGNYLSQDAAEMLGDSLIQKLKENMRL